MTDCGRSVRPQPIEPVGHETKACNAARRSFVACGWACTKAVSCASPNMAGAICRHVSQSIHVVSTKKSPGTFSGTLLMRLAKAVASDIYCTGGGPRFVLAERRQWA